MICKGDYIDYTDFITSASGEEIQGFQKGVLHTVEALGVKEYGYRLITNIGIHGGQEIPHLHYHIVAGETLGAIV